MSNLSAAQRNGLAYLQKLLRYANLPEDMDIVNLFFKKEGKKEEPVFSGGVTVGELLAADINDDDIEQQVLFAADEAHNMWAEKRENTTYFLESPDGSGRIPLTKDGLQVLKVNSISVSQKSVGEYLKLKEELGDFLGTSPKEGEAVKGDLTDKKVWERLLCKDAEGNFKPISIDFAKFTGDMKQDRLQVLADVEKYLKNGNLYVKDDHGAVSKVEMAKDRTLYRGQFERDTLQETVKAEISDAHGSVAMFLMRLFQSIGIHWFDDLIKEQDLVEMHREERINLYQDDREYEIRKMKNNDSRMLPEFTRQAHKLVKRDMSPEDFEQMLSVMVNEGAKPLGEVYVTQRVNINHNALIARAMHEPARDLLNSAEQAKDKNAFLKKSRDAFLLLYNNTIRTVRETDLGRLKLVIQNDCVAAKTDAEHARNVVLHHLQELDEQVQNIYRAQARQDQKDLKQESKNNEKEVPVKKEPQKELESQPAPMKK